MSHQQWTASAPSPARDVQRVVVTNDGPILVEGPVDVVGPDGSVARSDRRVVALCTCRRSRIAPFCDTSHRDRARRGEQEGPRPARDRP